MPLSSDPAGKLEVDTNMSNNSTTSASPSPTSGKPPVAGDEPGMPNTCPSAALLLYYFTYHPSAGSPYPLLPTSMLFLSPLNDHQLSRGLPIPLGP